jgi:hypothetical protein
MASVRAVSRFDVVLEVDSPGDTLVNACAAACYDRMLTTSEDLSREVVHILILRLESVSRFERTGSLGGDEELGSGLTVGPAGRAYRGLGECVETTYQVPSHDEGKVGAHTSRVTDIIFVEKGDPDICVAPLASAGEGAVQTTPINATTARAVSVRLVNRRFMIPTPVQ